MTNWKVIENAIPSYNNYIGVYSKRNLDLTGGFIDMATLIGYQNDRDQYYYADTELYAGEEVGII